MQLKNYQQQALDDLGIWLESLKEAHKNTADAEEFYTDKGKPVPKEIQNCLRRFGEI